MRIGRLSSKQASISRFRNLTVKAALRKTTLPSGVALKASWLSKNGHIAEDGLAKWKKVVSRAAE